MDVLIKNIIYSSIQNLFKNQPEIFDNTLLTNFTEWNLSYHLANEISKYIFWLNTDIDVIKSSYENKRPDIIFHKRGINSLNYLVVELKKSKYDNKLDIIKIRRNWMEEPLKYRFGAYINIWGINKYKAVLVEQDNIETEINSCCNYIPLPHLSNNKIRRFQFMVERLKAKEQNIATGLDDQIHLIDTEILSIFTNGN